MDTPADLLRLFVEQGEEHVLILLDEEGRVAGWLMGAPQTFGYAAEEMLGRGIDCLFTAEDQAREVPRTELLTAEKSGRGEDDRWMVRKDGVRFWATGMVSCIRDRQGEIAGFAKVLRDRTDIKAQLDAQRNRIGALQEEVQQKTLVLGTAAHELRNPLGVLANAVQLIQQRFPGDSTIAVATQMLDRQVKYLRALIDDLLESARLRAGKVALQFEKLHLAEVIHKAVESCGASVRHKAQQIEVVLPPVAIALEGDSTRLQQVLVNLINNASKFSREGGRIWLKGTTEDETAVIRVIDEGRGVPADLLPYVFEMFTQGKQAAGSLGVGLSIAKEYVELHGGTIAVRSEGLDRGTEFIVRLPLHQGSRPAE